MREILYRVVPLVFSLIPPIFYEKKGINRFYLFYDFIFK